MARKPPKRIAKRKPSSEARKKKTMSIVLAFLMVISLGGIFFGTQQTTTNQNFEYEGQDFELVPDQSTGQLLFVTEIDDQQIPFYTLPQDALRIEQTGGLDPLLRNAEVITISTDGNVTNAPVFDEIRFGLDFYGGKATRVQHLALLTEVRFLFVVVLMQHRNNQLLKCSMESNQKCLSHKMAVCKLRFVKSIPRSFEIAFSIV